MSLNTRLEQASSAKSEFLANMSHELRTPLNAILGFTEMIVDGLYGEVPEELKEPLKDIQVNGRHLLRLINDVLDLAKIEAGRMELALREYSVPDLVGSVHASLRSLAAREGPRLRAPRCRTTCPPARGDDGRLTQCLMNLAGNALKFTRKGRVRDRGRRSKGERADLPRQRHGHRHSPETSWSMCSPSSGRSTPP